MRKKFDNGVIGVEEFTAIYNAMQSHEADTIRAGLLFVLDKGKFPIAVRR